MSECWKTTGQNLFSVLEAVSPLEVSGLRATRENLCTLRMVIGLYAQSSAISSTVLKKMYFGAFFPLHP